MDTVPGCSLDNPASLRLRLSLQSYPSSAMSRHGRSQSRWRHPKLANNRSFVITKLSSLLLISILIMFCTPVTASNTSFIRYGHIAEASISTDAADSARGREIIVDRRASPLQPRVEARRTPESRSAVRDENDDEDDSAPSTETVESLLSHMRRSSSSDTSASSTFTTSLQSFPSAFDSASIASNFTSETCPTFFTGFLNNATISSCHAISMLLQNSNSWFHSLSSPAATSQVLDTACSAPVTLCTDIMSDLASRLIKNDACGKDYQQGNPLVTSAYAGMIAYQPVYRATCLKDPSTNDYCLVEALTNSSSITDYSVYFLPLGTTLPASGRATCDACLQATMQVFSEASQSKGQPLTKTYIPAAEQINLGCGPNYVNTTIVVGSKQAIGAGSLMGRGRPNMALVVYGLIFSFGASVLEIL